MCAGYMCTLPSPYFHLFKLTIGFLHLSMYTPSLQISPNRVYVSKYHCEVSLLCILTSAQPVSESTQIVNNGAYNVSWRVVGDVVSFTVSARTTGWVGIGFSKDQLMVRPMQCVVILLFVDFCGMFVHIISIIIIICTDRYRCCGGRCRFSRKLCIRRVGICCNPGCTYSVCSE